MKLSEQEYKSLITKPSAERYRYSVQRCVQQQYFVTLADKEDENLAAMGDEDAEIVYLPLWPHEDFAKIFITGDWLGYKPERINLEDLLADVLPNLEEQGIGVAIFPIPGNYKSNITVAKFREDLYKELERQQNEMKSILNVDDEEAVVDHKEIDSDDDDVDPFAEKPLDDDGDEDDEE